MKAYRIIYITLLVLVPASCFITKERTSRDQDKASSLLETQYYKLFTDATKHALFGNNKNAITLYNTCINIFPERAAPYYQLSSVYLREKEIEKAKSYAEMAVSLDSSNTWYLLRLADIYQYLDIVDKAIVLYERILDINEDDEIRYNLAMLYSKEGSNDEAMRVLCLMEEENQESKEVILLKHNLFHAKREYDSAVYELQLITKYFPEDITGYGMLAEYLSEIDRNNYAQEVYHEILKKDSSNGIAILSFGEFFLKDNILDSAFYYFKKAFCCSDLTLNDKISIVVGYINNIEFLQKNYMRIDNLLDEIENKDRKFPYYAAKADIYINMEKYEKAKPFLDSALLYEKSNFMLWEQSMIINSYLEENEDVISIATECLNFFEDRPNVYLFRASAYYRLNEGEKAINDTKEILMTSTDNKIKVQAYNLAAEIYRGKEEFEKSDSCFEAILAIEPENLIVRNNYSYYLSLRGYNLQRAEELSKFTIEKEPKNPTYLDTYGWILYKMGDYKQARNFIEYAIRNGAYTNSEVLEHYGDIMDKLDNCQEALEAYENAYELDSSELLKKKIVDLKNDCE